MQEDELGAKHVRLLLDDLDGLEGLLAHLYWLAGYALRQAKWTVSFAVAFVCSPDVSELKVIDFIV